MKFEIGDRVRLDKKPLSGTSPECGTTGTIVERKKRPEDRASYFMIQWDDGTEDKGWWDHSEHPSGKSTVHFVRINPISMEDTRDYLAALAEFNQCAE